MERVSEEVRTIMERKGFEQMYRFSDQRPFRNRVPPKRTSFDPFWNVFLSVLTLVLALGEYAATPSPPTTYDPLQNEPSNERPSMSVSVN